MCNVLVVDDDRTSLTLITIILNRAGHDVYTTSSSDEGFELAHQLHPDIILLNDGMPHMTGGELCALIKGSSETTSIPVILISAGSRIHDPKYVEYSGADAVLSKPYTIGQIRNIISTHAIKSAACY